MTYVYFLTIVNSRNDPEKSPIGELIRFLNSIKNIFLRGYGVYSKYQSKTNHLPHPHVHVVIRTKKPINYRFALKNKSNGFKYWFEKLETIEDEKNVKRYIRKHKGVFFEIHSISRSSDTETSLNILENFGHSLTTLAMNLRHAIALSVIRINCSVRVAVGNEYTYSYSSAKILVAFSASSLNSFFTYKPPPFIYIDNPLTRFVTIYSYISIVVSKCLNTPALVPLQTASFRP